MKAKIWMRKNAQNLIISNLFGIAADVIKFMGAYFTILRGKLARLSLKNTRIWFSKVLLKKWLTFLRIMP